MDIREIKPVSPKECEQVGSMAKEIWTEHYAGILSAGQIDYMVETFQSPQAISQQIKEGYQYYWICYDGQTVGYLAIHPEDTSLFLSKIYIRRPFRGKKLSTCAVHYLTLLCQERGWDRIWLTVNKHNAGSIAAYKSLGFVKTRELVTDIGQGYVMDDDIMELTIPQKETSL